jgi:hypothetical protein
MILEETENPLAGKVWKLSKLPAFPAGESFHGANPKSSITCGQQARNPGRRKLLI